MQNKQFGKNILVFLISLLMSLLGAEWSVRMFYPQQLGMWSETRDGIVIHISDLTTYVKEYGHEVTFNSFGMRDREHTVEKADGRVRILVLGDSHMEGVQVSDESVVARLLEDHLGKESGQRVEVINAAVSGWGTDDQLAYLKRYGVRFKPDVILVAMTLQNDISDNLRETFHEFQGGILVEKPRVHTPWVEYSIGRVKAILAAHSHMYQLGRKYEVMDEARISGEMLNDHVVQLVSKSDTAEMVKGWSLTYELLKGIRSVAQGIGAEMAIVVIPLTYQLSESTFASFLARNNIDAHAVAQYKPQRQVKSFGEQERVEIIDLLPYLIRAQARGDPPVILPNDGHWSEYGHEVVGDAIAQELVERCLVRPPRKAHSESFPVARNCPHKTQQARRS